MVTDTLTGILNDAAYNNDAAVTGGAVSYASPVLTWTGNLAAGASAVITYSVTVDNPDNGDKTLTSTAASTAAGSSCPPGSGNTGCSLTVPILTPALTITSTASARHRRARGHGELHGHRHRLRPDPLHRRHRHRRPDRGARRRRLQRRRGRHHRRRQLRQPRPDLDREPEPRATATITYSVTVNNPDTGDKILANTVTSATPGSNCASGCTDPRCAVTVTVSQLAITTTANVSTTVARRCGGLHHHDDQYRADSLLRHHLTAGGTQGNDGTSNGDETASSGTLSVSATGAVWTGDIPVGGTVTLTGIVHGQQPRHRRPPADRERHLQRPGQQLPHRQHRPPLRAPASRS